MNSTESIRQAGLLIERALELDPEFAAAHGERAVLLASSFVDAVGGGFEQISLSPEEWEREVRERAERALARDPTVGSARVALALINMFTWHWTDALVEFRLAAQATPWDAGNLQFYALPPTPAMCGKASNSRNAHWS
jgi:hypothetical protein